MTHLIALSSSLRPWVAKELLAAEPELVLLEMIVALVVDSPRTVVAVPAVGVVGVVGVDRIDIATGHMLAAAREELAVAAYSNTALRWSTTQYAVEGYHMVGVVVVGKPVVVADQPQEEAMDMPMAVLLVEAGQVVAVEGMTGVTEELAGIAVAKVDRIDLEVAVDSDRGMTGTKAFRSFDLYRKTNAVEVAHFDEVMRKSPLGHC